MDIPLISKFECGYAQGVKNDSSGKNEVFANMTGTTPAAWNDPVKGGELAKSQMDRGADIVYAAAGATGQGVLKAAADAGKFGIGVNSNQNGLFPGHVLTSMLKHVDVATYDSFMDAKNGTWKPGVQVFGLKEDGVGYAVDDNNKASDHPDEGQGGGRQGRHHLGQDPGSRLHVRQQVPGVTGAGPKRRLASRGVMAGLDPATHVCAPPRQSAEVHAASQPTKTSAMPIIAGMAGTSPAMTWSAGARVTTEADKAPPAIELIGIDKSFGPVHANNNVNLIVERGVIHGIVGENGAGKSTLMSILYGFYEADAGEIRVNGEPVRIRSSREAISHGIGMVHQHFMLVPPLSVLENVMLGAEGGPLLAEGAGADPQAARPNSDGNTASRSIPTRSSANCRSACSSGSRS